MKAELMNPFVYAGMRVLMTEAGIGRCELDKPFLILVDQTRQAVSVVIGVSGGVRGLVIYGMDLAVAKRVVETMTGTALALADPMAQSALGELGNLITGLASTMMEENGFPCRISPPALVRGTGIRLTRVSIPMVTVPLQTGSGAILIQLALDEVASSEAEGVEVTAT
jgi:chemotaxis protein CheX